MSVEYKKDYMLIKSKVEAIGMDKVLGNRWGNATEFEDAMKAAHKNRPQEYVDFLVLREKVRELITEDLIWFNRFVTDLPNQVRIEPLHEHCYYYIKDGKEPPKSYYSAGPAIFQYNPKYRTNLKGEKIRVDKQVVLLPRTVGKTVLFLAQHNVQGYMQNPRKKRYLVQGNEKKAKDNLFQIKLYLMNPLLKAVAPDLFASDKKEYIDRGGKINNFTIDMPKPTFFDETDPANVNVAEFDIRREATFTIGTPRTSATGQHYDVVYFDDIVDENTSKSPEAMEELAKWHGAVMFLAEESGVLERYYTGTRWWEYDLYDDIMEDATVFVMPAEWEHEGKMHYLSKMHSKEVLDDMRKEKGTGEWVDAHMLMIPRKVESDVSIVNDDSFIFAFKKDDVDNVNKVNFDLDKIKEKSCVVSSFDPTYSSKAKGKRTTDSKATLINGFIHKGTLYIYDMWQTLGWDLEDTKGESALKIMQSIYLNNCTSHGVDWTVCDSQGTQKANTQMWFIAINKIAPSTVCKFHTKGSLTNTISKAERANIVLRERFMGGNIRIHHSLVAAIKEIKRETKGYDVLDCLIQLCLPENIGDWEGIGDLYDDIKYKRYEKMKRKNVINLKRSSLTGY